MLIHLSHISTENQLADSGTKFFEGKSKTKFRELLLGLAHMPANKFKEISEEYSKDINNISALVNPLCYEIQDVIIEYLSSTADPT